MGDNLGRISGTLLHNNLLRNGTDLAFETNLLYLDVTNARIGIKSNAPVRDLFINSDTGTTNLIVDTVADINSNWVISTNTIQNLNNSSIYIQPNQSSNPTIIAAGLGISNLEIDAGQILRNIVNNDNINLTPASGGIVNVTTNTLTVNGNIHATGNITADGNITFGNASTDTVTFAADITSDIIPEYNNQYNLGSSTNYWNELYSVNVNFTNITSSTLNVNNISLTTIPGNTLYVSVNGSDSSAGNHQHAPFATLKHALSVATAGTEIVIFPGTYTEIFPLTIPQGVSVRGTSIRSVSIQPTVGTNSNDAFLLNGETTVSFLTVQNFFYNSSANTGYAFRFASGFKSTTKSPYIFHVTVITKGSVTSVSDPRGYNQGDAGGGAYFDGSVANSTSMIPTGLLYATTFFTPNQNAITATNGVRIEAVNSFTYFAKRGWYLTQGTLGFASQGSSFGATLRSINGANVFGQYGAVADGANTIAHLIGHNFGYVGSGKDQTDNQSLVVQSQEVVKLNNGTIYFESVDQQGNYRIGNIFLVDQQTGAISLNAQSVNFAAMGSIVLNGTNGNTVIEALDIIASNIRIHGNDIDSLSGPVNFLAYSGATTVNTNVAITGTLNVSSDTTVNGNVYFGGASTNLVSINPYLTQTFKPNHNNTIDLGSASATKYWNNLYFLTLNNSALQITNNTISTLSAGTDLRLVASGTGIINIKNSSAQIDNSLTVGQNLTVTGTTSLKNTIINGDVLQTGDFNQTGSSNITGTVQFTGNVSITGSSYLDIGNFQLSGNTVSGLVTNGDLTYTANGIGNVWIGPAIKISNNNIINAWSSASTDTQKSLLFTPNGTGNVLINSTKSIILPIGDDSTRVLSANGEIRYNDLYNSIEGYESSGYVNFINLFSQDRKTYITGELTPNASDNTLRFSINNTVTTTITPTTLFNNTMYAGNVSISGNIISNTNTSNNITLSPSGSGLVKINSLPIITAPNIVRVPATGALTFNSTSNGYSKFTGSSGIVIPVGTKHDYPSSPATGAMRYTFDQGYAEVFDGTKWTTVGGTSAVLTESQVEDAMWVWDIALG